MSKKRGLVEFVPDPKQLEMMRSNFMGALEPVQRLCADYEGIPDVLITKEDRELLEVRLREVLPDAAVLINAYTRGITVNEYLRNKLEMRMRKQG